MDTVGDMGDGNLVLRHCGPEHLPHTARDLAVTRADPIGASREPQCQRRHTELLTVICGVLPAKSEELAAGDAKVSRALGEVAVHQIG